MNVMNDLEQIGKETALQTQTVSALTEESSATAEEIAASSQILAKMAQDLQQEIGKFKSIRSNEKRLWHDKSLAPFFNIINYT